MRMFSVFHPMLNVRFLPGCLIIIFLWSCGDVKDMPDEKQRDGKYGGILNINYKPGVKSLYPLRATENGSYMVLKNVMEGLLSVDGKTLSLLPSLAESWNVLDSSGRFIFHIRKGVFFHDDPCFPDGKGREVNAHDVAFCLKQLCEPGPYNESFWVIDDRIKGSREYYMSREAGDGKVKDVEGIRVVDDYTLEITLNRPFAGMLNIFTTHYTFVYPPEAVRKYGLQQMTAHAVGTGPFRLKEAMPSDYVVLARNENYWKRDKGEEPLPYLDGIVVRMDKNCNELADLKLGKISIILNSETEQIQEVESGNLGDGIRLSQIPSLAVICLGFQNQDRIFRNVSVRKALAMAIDKDRIARHLLNGKAMPASHGMVPPLFEAYPHDRVGSIPYDPDKARDLMAAAGYPEGKNFPVLEMVFHDRSSAIGEAIQQMLAENLGIRLRLVVVSFQDLLKKAYSGHMPLFRIGWTADYPDPETFLSQFYGAHVPLDPSQDADVNPFRYVNPLFDAILDRANKEMDIQKRMNLYAEADRMLVNDVPAVPLYYDMRTLLVRKEVHGIDESRMDPFDFSRVYFAKDL